MPKTLPKIISEVLDEFDNCFFNTDKNILRMKTTIIDRKQYYQNATSEGIKTFISSHITSIVSELVKQGIPEKHDASTRDDAYDDAYWYNKAIQDTLSNFKKLGVEIE